MRKALFLLPLLASAISLTAHADTMDIFTITGDSHVYIFTLPQVFSFPDQLHLATLPAQRTTGTIDGVSGQTFDVSFFTNIGTSGNSLEFNGINVPGGGITLSGGPLVALIGQSGTPGHLIDIANSSASGPDYFDLTITPQAAPSVPEPPTILLLATGTLGLLSTNRHRRSLP